MLIHSIKGLRFLHKSGIIHLDIKPGNLLVCRSLIVKINDFGEAYQKGT
jgi:serine/threonine protein kinase